MNRGCIESGQVAGRIGMIGMASFMIEQRVREIGICEVPGAFVAGTWRLVSDDFVKMAGVAALVSM